MKYAFVIAVSLLSLNLKAADNNEGFQATRQLTGQLLNDKESFGGKVVDTMDVADYTYVQFAHGKEKLWLATGKTKVKKGDVISFEDAQTMHKFHSKALNRTFEQIYFVSSLNIKSTMKQ